MTMLKSTLIFLGVFLMIHGKLVGSDWNLLIWLRVDPKLDVSLNHIEKRLK